MNSFRGLTFSSEEIQLLRGKVLSMNAVIPFAADPKLCARISALGIFQEIGTVNDELSNYIYLLDSGIRVNRESLRAEIIEYRGHVGVRIGSEESDRLEFRLRGGRELLHPTFSFHPDGAIKELVLFPETLAKITRLQGVEIVMVREWAKNTIFGGFDRTKRFYETNAWELVHNDTLRYSELLANRQIALLGTHDLSAHVAGIRREAIDELQILGAETRKRLLSYYGGVKTPTIFSLVLPYAAGVLLDDLAQSGNYGAESRRFVFERVMEAIDRRLTDPLERKTLLKFPESYEKLIELARDSDLSKVKRESSGLLGELIRELKQFTVAAA